MEELFEKQVGPVSDGVELSCELGDIAGVEGEIKNHLLVFEFLALVILLMTHD